MLILAGDHLYRMDYGRFIRFHRENQADVTVAVSARLGSRCATLWHPQDQRAGRIVAFQEKPQDTEALGAVWRAAAGASGPTWPRWASMCSGWTCWPACWRRAEGDDFGQHIVPAAIETARVYAFPFEGYWEDIGTISAFYEANLALTRPDPPFDFYDPNHPIYTRSRFLPPSRIDGCRLERVVVAEGCRLYDADIEECVIGLRSMVRPGARLRQVVMMGADFYEDEDDKAENRRLGRPHVGIGENARIERAIIDKNARIGQGVVIRSHEGEADREEEQYPIRDGIVVIPKNTVIPDGTTI